MIRILHFSDFHLTNEERPNQLVSYLTESIGKISTERQIDLVIFTGDMIDKGGKSFHSIDEAFESFERQVITPIIDKLKLPKERFIFIPGNHDAIIDRRAEYIKKGFLDDFPLTNANEIMNLKNSDDNEVNAMLRYRTEAFKRFEKRYYSSMPKDNYIYGDFESNFIFEINETKIGLTSFNSVWLSGRNDNKLFFGIDQITNSKTILKECEIKVAASHIKFDQFTEAERLTTRNQIILNYDLNLTGHTHQIDDTFIQLPDGASCCDITSSGTLNANSFIDDKNYKNSFQIIDIISNKAYDIQVYNQKDGEAFSLNTEFGVNGKWELRPESKTKMIEAEAETQLNIDLMFPFKPIDTAIKFDKKTFNGRSFITSKRNKECMHTMKESDENNIRLLGLSGIGKTRLVGETFKEVPNVYYAEAPEHINDGLKYLLEHVDNGVIIIDNCSLKMHNEAYHQIQQYQKNFKLISIYNILTIDEERPGANVLYIESEDNKEVVEKIIAESDIKDPVIVEQIKNYSDGISLMAIELINAYSSIGYVQFPPEKWYILERLLNLSDDVDKNKQSVLNTIAIFNPLGYKEDKKDEFNFIISHSEINHIHLNQEAVTDCFHTTIAEFRKRRLLDFRANCVNVRPKPLAEWLAEDWIKRTPHESWEAIIMELDKSGQLGNRLAEAMKNRFCSLISPEAKQLFNELNKHPFHNEKIILTQTGSQLIFSMSTVNQVAVAHNLYTLFAERNLEYIQKSIKGNIRRNIVWALEETCIDVNAFEESAKLLGLLSLAENENYSNNATGIFVEKFRIILSGTNATLKQKVAVLQSLYEKGNLTYNLLIKSIDQAFKTQSFHHVTTFTERKLNIKSSTSISIEDLKEYWNSCKDLLIKMSDEESAVEPILKIISNHVYDLARYNCEEILEEFVNYFAPKCDNDWDELRDNLIQLKKYHPELYAKNITYYDRIIAEVLYPKTFRKKVRAAWIEFDNRETVVDDIHNAYKKLMSPFGEEFIQNEIYNSEDFIELADNSDYHDQWLAMAIIEAMNREKKRKDVYAAFLRHIESQSTDYRSNFIERCISCDSDKDYISSIADILIKKKYYAMAFCILGMIDNQEHDQLKRIFQIISIKKLPSELINNYLYNNFNKNYEDIFKVSDMLFENSDVNKIDVAYNHLFQHIFAPQKEEFKPFVRRCGKRLIDYDFENSPMIKSQKAISLMESLLDNYNDQEFAKELNKRIIAYFDTNRHTGGNPFDSIYEKLLPKYESVILDDVLTALAAPSNKTSFYIETYFELGSGLGYGAGPLFKCDNDKLKMKCKEIPEILPERLAQMCPICNYDENGEWEGLSDFFIWLLDNFGDNDKVLEALTCNFESYSYFGDHSMTNYFISRRDLFKPLFKHKNPKVVSWAKKMFESEGKEVDMNRLQDEYENMIK